MKIKLAFATLLIICSGLFAQEFKFPKKTGTVTIGITGTQIMIDQGEVTVGDWFSFIYDKYYEEGSNSFPCCLDENNYKNAMPDTNLMPEKYRFMVRVFLRLELLQNDSNNFALYPFRGANANVKYYLPLINEEDKSGKSDMPYEQLPLYGRLARMLSLPMVGITYEQAQLYLAWRTERANKQPDIMKTGYKVKARMMTKEEWNKLAVNAGPHFDANKTAHIDSVNLKGCYLLGVKEDKPCESSMIGINLYGKGAVDVYSYNPDNLVLYNMFGNVSEMTQEKGTAMGGSYKDYAIACDVSKPISYSGAQPWLGFRCVFEFYK